METANPSREQIEQAAIELGASRAAVFKWRKRGIPARWQLRLLQIFPDPLKSQNTLNKPMQERSQ